MIVHSEKPGNAIVVALEYYPKDFEQYMSLVQYLQVEQYMSLVQYLQDEFLEENEDIRGEVQISI